MGRNKVYFEKPLDIKIIPHRNQTHIPSSDLGTIRGLLLGTGKINSAPYRNHLQFYKDMKKFWKNCRNNVNLKASMKASGITGKNVFKKEWYRLFVETKEYLGNFSKNIDLATLERKKKFTNEIIKKNKIKNKKNITMTKNDFINQSTSTTNLDSTNIHRLVEALATIAHDVESKEFRQMLEIIKTNNKFETDTDGVLEVDFGKLDNTSLEKLNMLANDLGLLE